MLLLDINECLDTSQRHNCSSNALCTDSDGGFQCSCLSGYSGDGVTCSDINECSNGQHLCSKQAVCNNTLASYTCVCVEGFSGSGISCTRK